MLQKREFASFAGEEASPLCNDDGDEIRGVARELQIFPLIKRLPQEEGGKGTKKAAR